MKRVYKVQTGVRKIYSHFDRFFAAAVVSIASMGGIALAAPIIANAAPDNGHNTLKGETSVTTLDACGYFIGTQQASNGHTTTSDGVATTTEHGTWTGVDNNYVNTPVQSLGAVHGSYSETYSTDANGVTTGTEDFNSNAGKVSQTFTYGPGVPGGFSVTVTGTRDLSFLTSDTAGNCYTGAFPRP